MADNDVRGQFQHVLSLLDSPYWRDLWDRLHLSVESFETLGLPYNAPDRLVWQTCQGHDVILFTGNRNQEGPDSLESALRTLNRPDSLPIITLSNPARLSRDRTYAHKVAERLMDYLLDLENYRGAGRLYVP